MDNYTLITGATGGLGKAYVRECASRNYNLVLTATNIDRLNTLKGEIEKEFPNIKIECCQCNLVDEEDRNKLFQFTTQNNLSIERLIASAGIDFEGPILEKEPEQVLKVIKVNVEATIHLFHKFLLLRNTENRFYFLDVSSLAGFYAMPQKAIYSSTKAMLTNFFIAMHEELKDENVYISIVCPGGMPTTTEMINSIKSQGLSGKLSSTDMSIVASHSLKALDKNKLIYIPGNFNKFLKGVSAPFPKGFVAKQINNRWKKTRAKAKKLGN